MKSLLTSLPVIPGRFLQWILIMSLGLNLLLFCVLFTPLNRWLCTPLIADDPPAKAEVMVILSYVDAYDTPGEGLPDLSTLSRLYKGLELYRQGLAPHIICVGGKYFPNAGKTYAVMMREFLLTAGVPAQDVSIQDDIPGDWNYYKNLLLVLDKYQFDFNQALVVTSPQNTYRIKRVFAKNGVGVKLISASKYILTDSNWHTRFADFRDLVNEYWAVVLFKILGRI